MAITASLGSGALPPVLVVLPGADLTDGAAWTLTGSTSSGFAWTPRGGSGTGDGVTQVALVDVGAPVNTVLTYTLTVAGATSSTDTITRTWSGHEALVSLDGSSVVDFRRMASGGDPREGERRFWASSVSGSVHPPIRLAPTAGAGTGGLIADVTGDNLAAMAAFLRTNKPCHLLHNVGECAIPGCDIPESETVYIISDSSDRSSRVDAAHRRYQLTTLLIDDPEPDYIVPLSTWDEFDAAWSGSTWADFDAWVAANSITWDDFDITDWTTVGA